MIEYDRIDLDESIDLNKTANSRECWLCNFCFFLDKNFNYQKSYCDGFHDMSMKILKEMLTQFIFGILAKMMQST